MTQRRSDKPLSDSEVLNYWNHINALWRRDKENAPKGVSFEWFSKFAQVKEFMKRQSESFNLCVTPGKTDQAHVWIKTKSLHDIEQFLVLTDAIMESAPFTAQRQPFVVAGHRIKEDVLLVLELIREGRKALRDIHRGLDEVGVFTTAQTVSRHIGVLRKLGLIRSEKDNSDKRRNVYLPMEKEEDDEKDTQE